MNPVIEKKTLSVCYRVLAKMEDARRQSRFGSTDSEGLPDALPAHQRPLPFLYQSTGIETRFTNTLDPSPRSRPLFHFHKPETLAGWLNDVSVSGEAVPATLRRRVHTLPHSGRSMNA